jgi:hypothetical protein
MAGADHAPNPIKSAVGAPEISPVRDHGVLQIGATCFVRLDFLVGKRLPIALPYLRKHLSLLGNAATIAPALGLSAFPGFAARGYRQS